jgi:hypothetical protein
MEERTALRTEDVDDFTEQLYNDFNAPGLPKSNFGNIPRDVILYMLKSYTNVTVPDILAYCRSFPNRRYCVDVWDRIFDRQFPEERVPFEALFGAGDRTTTPLTRLILYRLWHVAQVYQEHNPSELRLELSRLFPMEHLNVHLKFIIKEEVPNESCRVEIKCKAEFTYEDFDPNSDEGIRDLNNATALLARFPLTSTHEENILMHYLGLYVSVYRVDYVISEEDFHVYSTAAFLDWLRKLAVAIKPPYMFKTEQEAEYMGKEVCAECKAPEATKLARCCQQVWYCEQKCADRHWEREHALVCEKELTAAKAKKMLHDKKAHGHKISDKQRRYFGWVAGGKK